MAYPLLQHLVLLEALRIFSVLVNLLRHLIHFSKCAFFSSTKNAKYFGWSPKGIVVAPQRHSNDASLCEPASRPPAAGTAAVVRSSRCRLFARSFRVWSQVRALGGFSCALGSGPE